jgi:acyl-CoA dehydrogenase
MERLKAAARALGLWNLWISPDLAACFQPALQAALQAARMDPKTAALLTGPRLSVLDYAYLAKAMGRYTWCPEVFNCSAPDTGNMEVLARYGNPAQQAEWLLPLLAGKIRSCFAMTEKAVASSDATNVQSSVVRQGGEYVLNGVKCWISGACDPACAVAIFMAKNDPSAAPHRQQCMVLVPMRAAGVRVVRPMTVFGDNDAPHGHAEMEFQDVRCDACASLVFS